MIAINLAKSGYDTLAEEENNAIIFEHIILLINTLYSLYKLYINTHLEKGFFDRISVKLFEPSLIAHFQVNSQTIRIQISVFLALK